MINDQIPEIGLGTFGSDRVDALEVAEAVRGALKAGYKMIDCAACYGNEAEIGNVLDELFKAGEVKREDVFIVSKVWNDMHERVAESCRKSIEELKCGYLDMLFIHWPFPNYHAPGCSVDSRNPDSKPFSVEEFMNTYRQLEALQEQGLIRHIGISNLTIPKLDAVLPLMKIRPFACESEMHPCFQQEELLQYLNEQGILSVAYMPMGSPRRPERDICEGDAVDMDEPVIRKIAQTHGCTPGEVCLKWAHQRGTVPIPFSVHHYEENLHAFDRDPLTDAEMKEITSCECGSRLVKGQVFLWEGANDWHDLWDEDGVIVKGPAC